MASIKKLELVNVTARSNNVTGDVKSLEQNTRNFIGFIKTANLGAGTTVTGFIQHSPNQTDWFDLMSFTGLTTDDSELQFPTTSVLPFIRGTATIAGGADVSDVLIEIWFEPSK